MVLIVCDQVTQRTYEHIAESGRFDDLRSTRHFGPMAYYLTIHHKIDSLLLDMLHRHLSVLATLLVTCSVYSLLVKFWGKINFLYTAVWLAAWLSSRTPVSGRRTFPVLHSTCSWRVTTYMGKPSDIGQPTRLTQPVIFSGSVDEY